jgi:hypothetical protein
MEAVMATLLQSEAVKADPIALFGKFAQRIYARRIEKAQMRFAPDRRMSYRND